MTLADPNDGFLIIAAESGQGIVDIHDRRALVLSPEHGRKWVDPETAPEHAAEITKQCCRPTGEFTWFKVSKDVGSVQNPGLHFIEKKADSGC